jgi:hypothetical protein
MEKTTKNEFKDNNENINLNIRNFGLNLFYNNISINDIISYISFNLQTIIKNNKKQKKKQSKINEPMYNKMAPDLSLEKFLIRIIKYTEVENNTLLIAYLYIIKFLNKENFVLSLNNVYRLLLGSVVLAKKVMEDLNYSNSYYCDIGCLSVKELNMIELSLFVRIDFELIIKEEELVSLYKKIYNFCSSSFLYSK